MSTTIVSGDQSVIGVRVRPDDRTLVVITYGNDPASPVDSPCWDRYLPSAAWAAGVVHLTMARAMNAAPAGPRQENCDAQPFIRSVSLVLDRPLENAPIVNGTATLRVFHGADLLVPAWLPERWGLATELPEQDPQATWSLLYEPDGGHPAEPTPPADPARPMIMVATYADEVSIPAPLGAEHVVVRGHEAMFGVRPGDRGTRQPPLAWLSWSEDGRTRQVTVQGDIGESDRRTICLRVVENLVRPA